MSFLNSLSSLIRALALYCSDFGQVCRSKCLVRHLTACSDYSGCSPRGTVSLRFHLWPFSLVCVLSARFFVWFVVFFANCKQYFTIILLKSSCEIICSSCIEDCHFHSWGQAVNGKNLLYWLTEINQWLPADFGLERKHIHQYLDTVAWFKNCISFTVSCFYHFQWDNFWIGFFLLVQVLFWNFF